MVLWKPQDLPQLKRLGVHSLCLERETSTGVLLAKFSRELPKTKRELAKLKRRNKRELAVLKPIIPCFDQLYPRNRSN